MSKKVYLVTYEGAINECYGSDIYCGGVFETLDAAKEVADEITKTLLTVEHKEKTNSDEWVKITPLCLNEKLIPDIDNSLDCWSPVVGLYLGGFVE